jgi:hypothetical protein
MKKLSLLLIVLMSFVRIGFGQVNPDVRAGEGRFETCQCGSKGVNISTGFDNGSNTAFQVGQAENQWKIISGPSGPQNPTGFSTPAWDVNNSNSTWIVPSVTLPGDYVYEYKFIVPAGSTGTLKFRRIGADDRITAKLDANPDFFVSDEIAGWYKKATLKQCIILDKIPAGTHSLLFTVKNMIPSITGLLVEGCLDFVSTVPECRCPAGWYSNTDQKDGGIIKGNDGCKKQVCVFDKALVPPKNGTVIGDPANPWGFTWENGFYVWGTKANGGAPICTLNGKVIDIEAYRATQGRGE